MSTGDISPYPFMLDGTDPLEFTPLNDSETKPVGTNQPGVGYPDISLMAPSQQQDALAQYLEAADAAAPAPFTESPPWGESVVDPEQITPELVILDAFMPDADVQPAEDFWTDPHERINEPFPAEFPSTEWYNDPQYFGLGVPPGVPNWDQPVESGHTQITITNPSAEAGWDAWTGRPVGGLGRVARHENYFDGYNASQSRGHGIVPEKFEMPLVYQTQQYRDLLLAELKRRGIHNVVVSDVPSVPWTDQVIAVDPSDLIAEAPITSEGVLPPDEYWGTHKNEPLAA